METNNQDRTISAVPGMDAEDRWRVELPDLVGYLIFWPILLFGLWADLATKRAVFAWLWDLPGQGTRILDGFLSFRLALNTGAAFGIAAGHQPLLIAVSAIALLAILGVFFFGAARQRLVQVSLGLFAAGVSGNLWDRIFNGGQVRDFIDVIYWPGRHWHTFNVADAMLCIAVALLLAATFLTGSSGRTRARPQK